VSTNIIEKDEEKKKKSKSKEILTLEREESLFSRGPHFERPQGKCGRLGETSAPNRAEQEKFL